MNIGEFFIKLGIVSDEGKIAKFSTAVNQSIAEVKTLAIAASATAYSVVKMVDDVTDRVVGLENFNKQTGLSIELLNKWQKAGQLSDVSLTYEQIANNIQALQDNLTELQFGGGNTQAFRFLGIDVTGKQAFEVLEDVRSAIKGIDDVTATNLIKKMGLSANFINVLRLSRQEFDKLGKSNFLSADQRKNIIEIGTALTKAKLELVEMKDRVIASLAPKLLQLFQSFQNLTRGLEDFIYRLQDSEATSNKFKIFLFGIAALIAPVSTAIVVAALALEDLWVALQGGEAVSLEVLKMISNPDFWKWGLESALQGLKNYYDMLKKLAELISDFAIDKLKDIGSFFGKFMFGSDAEASALQKNTAPAAGPTNNQNSTANITNNYNIQSNGDGRTLAEQIAGEQTRQFDFAFDELTGGAI